MNTGEPKSAKLRKWISEQPCAICEFFYSEFGSQPTCPQDTVVDHHLIPEDNGTRKSRDFDNLIPLGWNHHTGNCGVHTRFKAKERALMPSLRLLAKKYTKKFLTVFKERV
jgi:hypothetical protein